MAGSITKIGKKFRVTLELGRDSTGKRLRQYITASTESEAKRLLNEFEYNQQRNLIVQRVNISFSDFLNVWTENYVRYNCEETTSYGYMNIINNHIVPYLGNIEIQKLQTIHIQQYYKYLLDEKGLSPNTVHKHHHCIRKALDYGLKQQFVYHNVADAVSLPKKQKFEGKSYTRLELITLLNIIKGTKIELPISLAVYLGLRREEVVGLKWKYIDLTQRLVHICEVRTSAGSTVVVKSPKTDKSRRSLYITDELLLVLLEHKRTQEEYERLLGNEYQNSGYVYVNDRGKAYRVNSITEQFKKFLEKNNLPKIRLHDLRHTFASILYDEGVDLKAISEALGHSDLATTNKVYTHRFDKTHRSTVSAISTALSKMNL